MECGIHVIHNMSILAKVCINRAAIPYDRYSIPFQHSVNDLQSNRIPELLQAVPTVKIRQNILMKVYDLSKKYSKARYMYVMCIIDAHQHRIFHAERQMHQLHRGGNHFHGRAKILSRSWTTLYQEYIT